MLTKRASPPSPQEKPGPVLPLLVGANGAELCAVSRRLWSDCVQLPRVEAGADRDRSSAPPALVGLSIAPGSLIVPIGTAGDLIATVRNSAGAVVAVTVSRVSRGPVVASVNANGSAAEAKAGQADVILRISVLP